MAARKSSGPGRRSVQAYDDAERVRRYDRDMDRLHPNRHRMVAVALEVLSEFEGRRATVLELGTGTGFFASRLLTRHPGATLLGIDGAAHMIDLASARLRDAGVADRARLVLSNFEDFNPGEAGVDSVDIIFSSYALHHLRVDAKRNVLTRVLRHLNPGGWFLNADLVAHPDPSIEAVIQRIRVAGIVARNNVSADPDPRFSDAVRVRAFLDGLEESEGDSPLHLEQDLALLRESGIPRPAVFWQEYREVVLGGMSNRCSSSRARSR